MSFFYIALKLSWEVNTLLPIGSIVNIRDGTNKLMILNRGPVVEIEGKKMMFDYSGCHYPLGLADEEVLYFNEENIDEVIHEGFSDSDEERFQKLYNEWKQDNLHFYPKGKVNGRIK